MTRLVVTENILYVKKKLLFAPRNVFESILEYAVIPTFDLIIWFDKLGILLLRRKIPPYKYTWALPGLRMMKPEGIEDTLLRIAQTETGISINLKDKLFIGQYVGKFRTEQNRQDISTCYAVISYNLDFNINKEHFSSYRFIKEKKDIPSNIGAMYSFYLNLFFDQHSSFMK